MLLMLPFATLAIAACGRGASEEDAVRDAVREAVAAFNNKDFDKLADRLTANFYGFEPTAEALEGLLADSATRIEDLQLVSVTVEGQEATAEITRTQNGEAARETILLVKVGGRWRLDRSVESIIESGDEDQPGETPRLPPEEEPPPPKLTADDLPSLVLGAEEVGDVYPGIVLIEGAPWSNQEFIEGAPDSGLTPEEAQSEIKKYGRVAGYVASYGSPDGVEVILIDLTLHESAEGASAALTDAWEGFVRLAASADTEDLDLSDLADEAQGLVIRTPDRRVSVMLHLRVDNVRAVVAITPAANDDPRPEARQLAEKLAEKIGAVIKG